MIRLQNGTLFEALCDDLSDFYADAIILPNNPTLDWDHDMARRVIKKAGRSTFEKARQNAPVPLGEAIVTTGGGLLASFIVYVALLPPGASQAPSEEREANIISCVQNGLLRCVEIDLESVGMPNLGEYVDMSHKESARTILNAVAKMKLPAHSALKQVTCVTESDEQCGIFQNEAMKLSERREMTALA